MKDTFNEGLLSQEREVHKIVGETLKDIAKVERDIEKLPERKRLHLNYDAVCADQSELLKKDTAILKGVIESFKVSALYKADEILKSMPEEQRDVARKSVMEKLYPEREKIAGEEKNMHQNESLEKTANDIIYPQNSRMIFLSRFMNGKQEIGESAYSHHSFSKFLNNRPQRFKSEINIEIQG